MDEYGFQKGHFVNRGARPTITKSWPTKYLLGILFERKQTEQPPRINTKTKTMSSRPSQLAISTFSVQRLLKEESTYRAELASQELRLKRLEQGGGDGDDGEEEEEEGNREWRVGQEVWFLFLFLFFPSFRGGGMYEMPLILV